MSEKPNMVRRFLPFLSWFKGYNQALFKADLAAGLTVALVLIPQSMAYAQLAGLPAYYGLYAAFLPPVIAALFGSSHQLATGPVAVVSLMTAASLEPLAAAGSGAFIAYALLLSLVVGLFQFLLGALRLGAVVNFISHPVVNGFTNAAALIIASSQLAKFLGVEVDKAQYHLVTLARVFSAAANHLHWPSLLLGVLAFMIMYGMKRINPRLPYVLTAVVITSLTAWLTGFESNQRAPLSTIRSAGLAHTVGEFNNSLTEAHKLRILRGQALARADQVEASLGGSNPETLHARAQSQVLGLRIREAEDLVGFSRADIRRLLLVRVKDGQGGWVFYEKGKAPAGTEADGRTWRVKVGNAQLDETSMLLIGGGEVVGEVPPGLPGLVMPDISSVNILRLLPYAMIISLLGFMEAISVAKAMASKTGQRIDPDQELIGQGLSNIVGAFFQSYPVSGSFSRSAVNLQAGARTGFSSIFTGLAVLLALLFFTPLLYHLPLSVLAAVIMMAVVGLVNVRGFVHAWRAQKYDGVISIITFVVTLGLAPHLDQGILIGVVLSLLVFLYKSMRPKVVALAVAEDGTFHDAVHFGLPECKHVAMIRFDGPLFFANAAFLEDQIRERRLAMPELRQLIILAEGINELDASGEEALSHIYDRLRKAGIGLSLADVHWRVKAVLARTHLLAKIGEENIYPDPITALKKVHAIAHQNSSEGDTCPLMEVCSDDDPPPEERK